MCLPDFIEFKTLSKAEAVIGYRTWRLEIKDESQNLISEHQDYYWPVELVSHEVKEENSGIYSYNNNYNYNNYNYNNYNYNYINYNNNNNYNINGIIRQFGKVAIHETGYRSQFAIIDTILTIRESDAKGSDKFINWVKEFNLRLGEVAKKYGAKTIHYQDFIEGQK